MTKIANITTIPPTAAPTATGIVEDARNININQICKRAQHAEAWGVDVNEEIDDDDDGNEDEFWANTVIVVVGMAIVVFNNAVLIGACDDDTVLTGVLVNTLDNVVGANVTAVDFAVDVESVGAIVVGIKVVVDEYIFEVVELKLVVVNGTDVALIDVDVG